MDGRGRALDNVFIERLWRTVKYEDIYLKDYETARRLQSGLGRGATGLPHGHVASVNCISPSVDR